MGDKLEKVERGSDPIAMLIGSAIGIAGVFGVWESVLTADGVAQFTGFSLTAAAAIRMLIRRRG